MAGNAAIDLDKSGTLNDDDGTPGLSPGDTISYVFTVTNTGAVTLSGITLADTVGGVTISGGPIATLAPGAVDSTTFTGSYTVTQVDIDAGTFTNTATVTGTPPSGPPVTDPDVDVQPLAGNAVLTLVKSASPATYNAVGDVISYDYDLINAGNTSLYPPYTVTDDKTTVTCPATPAALAPGAFVTCTATYVITAADILAGNVINVASAIAQDAAVGGTPVVSNEDTEQVDVVRINLAKIVTSPAVLQGDGSYTVTYSITATNTGAGPGMYDLVDTFSPGAGITLNSATAVYVAGTESAQTGTISSPFSSGDTVVDDESLAGGLNESWTVTANFAVDPALVDQASSSCDSGAPVVSTGFYNLVTGSDTDTDLSDNDACIGLPDPGINLAKTVNGPAVLQGNGSYNVVYTVTATNTGQGPGVYDLVDTFTPPTGVTLNSATAAYVAGSESSQVGTITSPFTSGATVVSAETLAGGQDEAWTITANFTVDPTALDPTLAACAVQGSASGTGFYNYADGSATDPDLSDNDACTDIPTPSINLAKTVNGPAVRGAGGVYTVVYTVTATNTTNGSGAYDIVDTFTPGVGITLTSAQLVYAGGETQTGTISSPFSSGDTIVAGEGIAANATESWTITATYTADLTQVTAEGNDCDATNAGGINTGFANGVTGSDTDTDLTDNDACTPFDPPSINLVKTADVATYANVGDVINYTYLITNAGPDTLDPGLASVLDDQVLVTCPAPTPLPPNGTVTCTSLHTITQFDLDNGSLTNIAIAMVDDVESNDDTVTVTSRPFLPPINVPTLSWQGLLALMLLMLFAYGFHTRRHY